MSQLPRERLQHHRQPSALRLGKSGQRLVQAGTDRFGADVRSEPALSLLEQGERRWVLPAALVPRATLDSRAVQRELTRLGQRRVSIGSSLDTSSWAAEARTATQRLNVNVSASLGLRRLTARIRDGYSRPSLPLRTYGSRPSSASCASCARCSAACR